MTSKNRPPQNLNSFSQIKTQIYANVAPRFEKAAALHQSNQVLALTTAILLFKLGLTSVQAARVDDVVAREHAARWAATGPQSSTTGLSGPWCVGGTGAMGRPGPAAQCRLTAGASYASGHRVPRGLAPRAMERRRFCHTCWRLAFRNRKYFRTNSPSREASGAPQTRHAISPSRVSGPASALTT